MSELQDIRAYIDQDNRDARAIFDGLRLGYSESLSSYPAESNLIGVYFFEFLKLLTQSHFKKRELECRRSPSDQNVLRSLVRWPYLGYRDITDGFEFSEKCYGKDISVQQPSSWLLLERISNFRASLLGGRRTSLSVVTPGIDRCANLWRDSNRIKVRLIRLPENWFALPQFEDQLQGALELIESVMQGVGHKMPASVIRPLMERHVRSNCREGESTISLAGDSILLKSGIELSNRMIGQVARKHGKQVVNVMHGEAFGVADDPTFSDIGEHVFSSAILGYGPEVAANQAAYEFAIQPECRYLQSDGPQVKAHYQPAFGGITSDPADAVFYYYPTTLSGASHRYGPYRDTADSIYIQWQRRMTEVFGNRIKIKSHPKEKYISENLFPGVDQVQGDFESLLPNIDVFVFDYIGTAFNVACATGKPIIYFDLGIRKINPRALEEIKRRTIYFDIAEGMPSMDDICDRLRFDEQHNRYSLKYSLSEMGVSRMQALDAYLMQ